ALSQCTVFMASGRWRSKVVVFSLLVRAYALSFVLGCKLLRLAFLTTKPSYAYTLGLCGREWGSGARLGRPSQVSATSHVAPSALLGFELPAANLNAGPNQGSRCETSRSGACTYRLSAETAHTGRIGYVPLI